MNKYANEKVAIRAAKTRDSVYSALEGAGVSVCSTYSIHKRLKDCRNAYQHELCELIQVAMYRLNQIDNQEI